MTPHIKGAVGFDEGDYTMVNDFTVVWWTNERPSRYGTGQGAFCWPLMRRYSLGKWPPVEPDLFNRNTCGW